MKCCNSFAWKYAATFFTSTIGLVWYQYSWLYLWNLLQTKARRGFMSDLVMFFLWEDKAGWYRSIEILMVGVSFNIYALDQTEQLLLSLKSSSTLLRSQFSLCRTPNSFVLKSDSFSFEITEMKRFSEDFRNNCTKVCKILALNSICLIFPILLVACYCWKVENRYHVILVHASFGRCLPW